ncbi:CocE/NonD family hydrolase [Pendulispora albinea]|uniref:CocE/NonD family hydrolase n=1 Tax=Pendulispora albinea TaxID=2741071 RepID=A0ABZ2MCI2_9BACT
MRRFIPTGLAALALIGCQNDANTEGNTLQSAIEPHPNPSAGTPSAAGAGWTTNGTRGKTRAPSAPITTTPGGSWSDYDPPSLYPRTVTLPTQYIPMADGVKLAVLVTLPADIGGKPISGPLPVVLQETDYNAALATVASDALQPVVPGLSWLGSVIGAYDPYMVKHGYVNVSVDGRGTGNSEGVWRAFDPDHQADDDERVLDWIVAQPWSNGSIGVAGISDVGIHAFLFAQTGHPAVKAVISEGAGGDTYRDVAITGGQGNLLFFSTWFSLTTLVSAINPQVLTNPATALPLTLQHLTNALTDFQVPKFVSAVLGDPALVYDGAFFAGRSPVEATDAIKVPTFIVTTAHDIWQRGMPLMYEGIKHNAPTKMLVGSGTHAEMALNLRMTGDGVPIFDRIQLRWFDQYVKGLHVGADTLPNVTQDVLGYGHMATATDWPHPDAHAERYYLHGNKQLTAAAPTDSPFEKNDPRKLVQYPLNGICSISTSQWTLGALSLLPIPCFHQDNLTELFNLVYETPVLQQDMYINGPLQADIWASTSEKGGSISVRVDDVDIFGNATPLSNGLLNDQFRQVDASRSRTLDGQMIQPWHPYTAASAQPVVPGEIMKLSVEVFPTAALLEAGHRLRVAIGPSNAPQGVPVGEQIQLQSPIGTMTVYNDPSHPSSIVVPVVPVSKLR